ncbi:hypothetical protein L484_014509 [Morus notabilis]|uniref:Uncharacterized protein n=1 Tax=Morus notabilis TaxID=981085 RepID=W9SN96_9ROSA|nr:hypothetical protein L484_014509 [Morus notabilis]
MQKGEIQELIVLFSPGIDNKEDPRESQKNVADALPDPIPGKVLDSALEVNPPERHENVEDRTALGEEVLEFPVPHDRHHHEEEPDRDQEQPRERIGGPNQELVVRCGPQQPDRRLAAVPERVDLLHVEHHQAAAAYGDQTVENADHEERRRRRRRW